MKKLLQKIAWKTRKIRIVTTFLKIYLHGQQGTNVTRFTVDSWDFLYLSRLLWKEYDNLSDHYMWSMNDPEGWDKFKLNILGKLFR